MDLDQDLDIETAMPCDLINMTPLDFRSGMLKRQSEIYDTIEGKKNEAMG